MADGKSSTRRPPVLTPEHQRLIDQFVAERGVTTCPSKHAEGSKEINTRYALEQADISRTSLYEIEVLARAKLCEAFVSLLREGSTLALRNDSYMWYRWLISKSWDFVQWCELAGFEPSFIRQKAEEIWLSRDRGDLSKYSLRGFNRGPKITSKKGKKDDSGPSL